MPPLKNDHELLQAYVEWRDEAAFAALVARHADMVYAAAVRQVGRAGGLAEDVTQATFILLSRKASTISNAVVVAAWLHKATRFVALNAMKIERRRRIHERRAAESVSLAHQGTAVPQVDHSWAQGVALLDEAIARLNHKDREAVILRFLERRSFGEVGRAIGASEDAAQMRVSRAVEKLRGFFRRKGLVLSAATLRASVNGYACMPAPATLKVGLAPAAIHATSSHAAAAAVAGGSNALRFANAGGRSMMLASGRVAAAYAATGVAASIAGFFVITHLLLSGSNVPTATTQPRNPSTRDARSGTDLQPVDTSRSHHWHDRPLLACVEEVQRILSER